ncbi:hypothetical protein N7548_01545 [Acholeplasma manati]|uniref:Uncharacterized protein n=1 Tax=Paracholeplasma manati TaxID=591373 RepID=A0ABT2Y4W3_9MOLU|nr:hypothetical protein [Paracholeplasma manati]MCV2231512.1 hypothetical protein [Paracholeplasma manati]
MFIMLREKGTTYFATSVSSISLYCYDIDAFLIEENIPFWKVKGSKNTIMAVFPSLRDADILRYEPIHITLTYSNLVETIIPKYNFLLKSMGRLNEEGNMNCGIYIAKNDDAYFVDTDETIKILSYDNQFGSSLLTATLLAHKDNDPITRLVLSIKADCEDNFKNPFPIAILDTKTERIRYIHSMEDL